MLAPGELFADRYRIERLLAKGGMGSIYQARCTFTAQRVALKVLDGRFASNDSMLRKFALEARVAGLVGSGHIVKVLDAGTDAGRGVPYLTMELLRGETLAERVARRGKLTAEEAAPLLRDTAAGLWAAHGHKTEDGRPAPIVHRDLKPQNLFIVRDDEGRESIKILDFGIAKMLERGDDTSLSVQGTPVYMAPEQMFARGVSPQTDMWAFGLVALFALTGSRYWRSTASAEPPIGALCDEIARDPIEPPSVRLGAAVVLPEGFDGWFLRCVAREPHQRFSTMLQAGDALLEVLLGRGAPRVRMEAREPLGAELAAAAQLLESPLAAPGAIAGAARVGATTAELSGSLPELVSEVRAPSVPSRGGMGPRRLGPWLAGAAAFGLLVGAVALRWEGRVETTPYELELSLHRQSAAGSGAPPIPADPRAEASDEPAPETAEVAAPAGVSPAPQPALAGARQEPERAPVRPKPSAEPRQDSPSPTRSPPREVVIAKEFGNSKRAAGAPAAQKQGRAERAAPPEAGDSVPALRCGHGESAAFDALLGRWVCAPEEANERQAH